VSLPKPENNFELLVPDDKGSDSTEVDGALSVEDAAHRLKRIQEKEEHKLLVRRSSAGYQCQYHRTVAELQVEYRQGRVWSCSRSNTDPRQ